MSKSFGSRTLVRIQLPNNWRPRPYQRPLWDYLERGGKRALAVWHRRAGKDSVCLNRTAIAAHERRGVYWHMLPQAKQARKVVWDGIDRAGRRIIDQAFPRSLRVSTNETEMKIGFKCGSIWQVVGSDNYNSLMGSNPVGVVFSEYSIAKPSAWDYIRPILAENGGWALFIYTGRGPNHGLALYRMACEHPGWFSELLTVDDTEVLTPADIDEERRSGMSEEMIEQEYYGSFLGVQAGSFYGKLIAAAEKEGRVTQVPYEPAAPVHTAWDLGYSDDTVIWFYQVVSGEVRLIDYYAAYGQDVAHYAGVIHGKPYSYGNHWVPHDAIPKTLAANGRSIIQQLWSEGVKARVAPHLDVQDGIQAVRQMLPRCWFDKERCKDGIEDLRLYQREWDEDRKCFRDKPLHDHTSHSADGFRYLALVWREEHKPEKPKPKIRTIHDATLDELWDLQRKQTGKRI
jgi:phage terminase large subunit